MNHEKMEAIELITLAEIVMAVIFALLYHLSAPERERLAQVQSGEVELVCLMKDGERVIVPEMVIDLLDDTWVFKTALLKDAELLNKR